MELIINRTTYNFEEENLTIQTLMDRLYPNTHKGLAVAVHEHVIATGNWSTTFLSDNDQILVLTATQGG